jgi:hypothetical protein
MEGSGLQNVVQQLGERVSSLEAERQAKALEAHSAAVQKFVGDLQSNTYDKAAAYTTLIVGAGYVGFFAIWGWVAPYLQRWETLSSALLIGSSLLMYVLWQVYGMITNAYSQMRIAKVIVAPNADVPKAFKDYENAARRAQSRIAIIQPLALWTTVAPGVTGALILLEASAWRLISAPYP